MYSRFGSRWDYQTDSASRNWVFNLWSYNFPALNYLTYLVVAYIHFLQSKKCIMQPHLYAIECISWLLGLSSFSGIFLEQFHRFCGHFPKKLKFSSVLGNFAFSFFQVYWQPNFAPAPVLYLYLTFLFFRFVFAFDWDNFALAPSCHVQFGNELADTQRLHLSGQNYDVIFMHILRTQFN